MTISLSDLVNPLAPPEDSVEIQSNGSVITSKATSLNFTGFDVTHTGSAVSIEAPSPNYEIVTQTAHGFSVKSCIQKDIDSNLFSDLQSSYDFYGIVTEVIDANTFVVTRRGLVTGLTGLIADNFYTAFNGMLWDIYGNSDIGLRCDYGQDIAVFRAVNSTSGYILEESLVGSRPSDYISLGVAILAGNIDSTKQVLCTYMGMDTQPPLELASAASENTLATHVAVSSGDVFKGCISLYTSARPLYGYSTPLDPVAITAADGTKVYLSETPGEVTITPPVIKQVVGVIKDDTVCWIQPYREYNTPKITVATTSPSSPAVGDVWIDIS